MRTQRPTLKKDDHCKKKHRNHINTFNHQSQDSQKNKNRSVDQLMKTCRVNPNRLSLIQTDKKRESMHVERMAKIQNIQNISQNHSFVLKKSERDLLEIQIAELNKKLIEDKCKFEDKLNLLKLQVKLERQKVILIENQKYSLVIQNANLRNNIIQHSARAKLELKQKQNAFLLQRNKLTRHTQDLLRNSKLQQLQISLQKGQIQKLLKQQNQLTRINHQLQTRNSSLSANNQERSQQIKLLLTKIEANRIQEGKVHELNQVLKKGTSRLKHIEEELELTRKSAQSYRQSEAKLKQQITMLEKQMIYYKNQVKNHKQLLSLAQNINQESARTKDKHQRQMKLISNELQSSKSRIVELYQLIETKNRINEQIKRQFELKLKEQRCQKQSVEKQLHYCRARCESSQQKLSKANQRVYTQNNEAEKLSIQLLQTQSNRKNTEKIIDEMQNTIQQLNCKIKQLQNYNRQASVKLKSAEAEISRLNGKVQSKQSDLLLESQAWKQKYDKIQQQYNNMMSKHVSLSNLEREHEDKLVILNSQCLELKSNEQQANNIRNSLEKKNRYLQDEVMRLANQFINSQLIIVKYKNTEEQINKKFNQLQQQKTNLARQCQSYKLQINKIRQNTHASKRQIINIINLFMTSNDRLLQEAIKSKGQVIDQEMVQSLGLLHNNISALKVEKNKIQFEKLNKAKKLPQVAYHQTAASTDVINILQQQKLELFEQNGKLISEIQKINNFNNEETARIKGDAEQKYRILQRQDHKNWEAQRYIMQQQIKRLGNQITKMNDTTIIMSAQGQGSHFKDAENKKRSLLQQLQDHIQTYRNRQEQIVARLAEKEKELQHKARLITQFTYQCNKIKLDLEQKQLRIQLLNETINSQLKVIQCYELEAKQHSKCNQIIINLTSQKQQLIKELQFKDNIVRTLKSL